MDLAGVQAAAAQVRVRVFSSDTMIVLLNRIFSLSKSKEEDTINIMLTLI